MTKKKEVRVPGDRSPNRMMSASAGGPEPALPADQSFTGSLDTPANTTHLESAHVVVVDDEPLVLRTLEKVLTWAGFLVSAFDSAGEALSAINSGIAVDLLLTDICMPEIDGLELLRKFKADHPDVPVLILTGSPNNTTAIEAMNHGAAHYLIKPVNADELQVVVRHTLESSRTRKENLRLQSQLCGVAANTPPMLWKSAPMRRVMEQVKRLADLDTSVLITGENGTGKELLAQHLHRQSSRTEAPFVPINCGAIPRELLESELFGHKRGSFTGAISNHRGLFVEAQAGTLFLDEVGDLPLDMQVKLLRALDTRQIRAVGDTQSRSVDLRIIAATNRNLEEAVSRRLFRQDLYYRLNVFRVLLPPLRERQEDIPLLARYFLRQSASSFNRPVRDFTSTAMQSLLTYSWPGNVRELSNAVQRAVVLCGAGLVDAVHLLFEQTDADGVTYSADLPDQPSEPQDLNLKAALEKSRSEIEPQYIRLALERSEGNRTRAAKLLGLSYRALLYKLKDYEL